MDTVDIVCADSLISTSPNGGSGVFVAEEGKKQAGLGSLSPQANIIINIYPRLSSQCSETPKFVCTQ
jgi:hypothetical protein